MVYLVAPCIYCTYLLLTIWYKNKTVWELSYGKLGEIQMKLGDITEILLGEAMEFGD